MLKRAVRLYVSAVLVIYDRAGLKRQAAVMYQLRERLS
jgi:hypothetical protein